MIKTFENGSKYFLEIKDFWKYVQSKNLTQQDIVSLSPAKKDEFFLRWKHGSKDHFVNQEFEQSLQEFLFSHKDENLDDVHVDIRGSLKIRREFDSYCYSIKQQIGLVGNEKQPKEVREIANRFGGKVKGWQE